MSVRDDPRLCEAKGKSVSHVLGLLGVTGLRRTSNMRELSGSCPKCGAAGHNPKSGPPDRFNINLSTGAFFCRRCDMRGGDVIALVRAVNDCTFDAALTILCGERPREETEDQRRARKTRRRALEEKLKRDAQEQAEDAERHRRRGLVGARAIWTRARPGETSPVMRAYLAARALTPALLPELPKTLRIIEDHPYMRRIGGETITLHRGPCMVAAIQGPDGRLRAVHRTWIDPDPPHGKARIVHKGEDLPAKLVRGVKKGGAIRLCTPRGAETLVMGEGIETTLTARAARPLPEATTAYWAGVDLGNMAGRMRRLRGLRVSGLPDMEDARAFVPPSWVRRLIFVMDGDSDPETTRAALHCGLRRAMLLRPGLQAQIVHPGDGRDLNDLIAGEMA